MCWVAAVPYILAAVGAYTSYSSSVATKNQGEYQAQVASNNAKVADWQAQDAKDRGDAAAADVRRKYAALEGTQTASLAARGIDISEGSANSILTDTSFFGDMDQRTVRANAAREAWGYKVRASNFAGDSAFLQSGADAQSPYLSGLIGGASAYYGAKGKTGLVSDKPSALTSSTAVDRSWYGSGTNWNGSAGTAYNGYSG